LLIEDVAAAHVRRHEVGRELNAAVIARQHLPEHTHEQGLAQAGRAFEQHMAAREQGDEGVFDQIGLPDQGALDLASDSVKRGFEFVCVHRFLLFLRAACTARPAVSKSRASFSAGTPLPASRASRSMRITSPTGRPVRVATASAKAGQAAIAAQAAALAQTFAGVGAHETQGQAFAARPRIVQPQART
jgi:hypothetical protein